MEFSIAVQDEGTAAQNEVAVFRSTLRFAKELTERSATSRIMSFRIDEHLEIVFGDRAVRRLRL